MSRDIIRTGFRNRLGCSVGCGLRGMNVETDQLKSVRMVQLRDNGISIKEMPVRMERNRYQEISNRYSF